MSHKDESARAIIAQESALWECLAHLESLCDTLEQYKPDATDRERITEARAAIAKARGD